MIADIHAWLIAGLSADVALRDDLGDPPRIFDTVPRRRQLPCVVLGPIEQSDWSASDAKGVALVVSLTIWSRAQNRAELYRIAERIGIALDAADPVHGDMRIVLTAPLASAYRFDRDQDAFRGQLRFRLLCEPAGG